MKKSIISLLCLLLSLLAYSQVSLGFPGEEHAFVGIYVKDLTTGKVIAQNDAKKALIPASVMKSVTAAASLLSLDKNFTFSTPVYIYGDKTANVWNGNIVIESCGDPTIDSENFKERTPLAMEIVNALKSAGISKVNGQIVINEYLQDAGCIPEWQIDDVAWAYGAGLFGFNFNDNASSLSLASGKTSPAIPNLNLIKNYRDSGVDLVRGVFSDNLLVWGRDLSNPKLKVSTTIPNPAEAFRNELANKLAENGITLTYQKSNSVNTRQLLVDHKSPVLIPMLRQMMEHSHNLYAEGMLRALSPDGSRKEALTAEAKALQRLGVNCKYNKIYDGSGLARGDRLQPAFISDIFEAMISTDYANDYVALFPLVGKEGTVKNLLAKTPLAGKLALKSGSMSAVHCYAGYKLDNEGNPTHTVVILINSFYCERRLIREAIEKFLLSTFPE